MKINKLQLSCLALQLLVTALLARCDDLSVSPAGQNDAIDSKQEKGGLPSILKYSNYLQHFKKAYLKIEPLEVARKAKLFLGRTMQIFQQNTQYVEKKTPYYLAQNEFTDLTPEELSQGLHAGGGGELEPVAELNRFPTDLPADTVRKLDHQLNEGFSSSSLDQIQSIPSANRVGSDFTRKLDDDELRKALEAVNELPDRETKKFGDIINLKYDDENNTDEQFEEQRLARGITHKTIVESNNKDYDPLMTTSHGLWEEFEILPEHYTKYGLNDIMSDFNLEPYPMADIPKHKVLIDEDDNGLLSGLMNAIKDIYHGLDDDDDALLEDEWVSVETKPKKRDINYDIDWRKTGCISGVKAQKFCNSCYAFTVIGLMEYFYCRQTKSLTDFSVQYIVDCGVKNDLRGCKGGKITNVGRFIRQFGIELNAMYPYRGSENQCPIEEDNSASKERKKIGYLRPQITKWQNFPEIAAWYKWLPKSPLIVGINMPADFLAYGGGIHDGLNCELGKTHAMLLVGSGSEDNREFWLLKNSYSDLWGENGYFRLSKSAPIRCFNSAIVVRANFVEGVKST